MKWLTDARQAVARRVVLQAVIVLVAGALGATVDAGLLEQAVADHLLAALKLFAS